MHGIRKAALIGMALLVLSKAFAARTNFNGYSDKVCIDLPEGFKLDSSNGENSFQLQSTVAPVHAIVQIHKPGKYESTFDAMKTTIQKFGLKGDTDSFEWRGNKAAVSIFNGTLMGIPSAGYGAAALIPEDNSIIAVLAWASQVDAEKCNSYMTSLIDSIYVDMESYYSCGLLTEYTFPKKEEKKISLTIDERRIQTTLDSSDKEASEYLVDREYQVLLMYQNSDFWKEAWQRYYRMIFRDSCGRLRQAAFDIYNALAPSCKDSTDLAQKLLNWTQKFKYEREKNSSDFTSLPSILLGSGSDCDSRSLLLAVLLQAMNEDAIFFVSSEFKHAIAGFASDHPGFSFTVNGIQYLTGETTVKGVSWGKIDGTQTDFSKWIVVSLP